MRSSALAGFLASAVFVSGSAGFASTFLVGPYLGEHLRPHPTRVALMSTTKPVDPLAVLQAPGATTSAGFEGEPPASQKARRLRNVENAPRPQPSAATVTAPTSDTASSDVPPVTEEAFAPTAPSTIPAASGGPLIAAETTSALVSSKLENGEPVLTLRIAPVVTAAAPAVDATDPDNAVEPTVISAPPSEQALATPAIAVAPTLAPPPAAPAAEPQRAPTIHPHVKPALAEPAPEPEPVSHHTHAKPTPPPARVTTTAAPAHVAPAKEPITVEAPPVPTAADPLNAPYTPLTIEEPVAPAPASPPPAPATGQPQPTGGPTPLVMPQ